MGYTEYSTDQRHVASQSYIAVPLIELVRKFLCQHPVGTMIETSVRKLAEKVGRPQSAGAITPVLNRLEADGWIARLAGLEGTFVEVKRSDPAFDRLETSAAPPQPTETQNALQISDQDADRHAGRKASDQAADRSACMEDHDLIQQEEEKSASARDFLTASDPRIDELLALGCYTCDKAQAVLDAQDPEFTAADAAAALALGQKRRKGAGYVWNVLANGRQLAPAPERPPRPQREQPAPATQSRPATHADEEAEQRRAYVEAISPDADDELIAMLLDCFDRGLTADEARVELEAAYAAT